MPAIPTETAAELLYIDQDHPLAGFTFDNTLGCHQSPPPQRLLVSLPDRLRPPDVRQGMLLAVRLGWAIVQGKRWRHVQVLRLAAPVGAQSDSSPTGARTGGEPTAFSVLLARAPRTDRPGGARGDVGRKALVAGEFTEAHSITLPASVWRRVEEIGDGNRSEGVRRLVEGNKPGIHSPGEDLAEFRRQLRDGATQKAYAALLSYMLGLRTHFKASLPDTAVSGLYQGYLDMTYFALFPPQLKPHDLKIAIVFNYAAFRFEAWLAGSNRPVQRRYWELFRDSRWPDYRVVAPAPGVDAIVECDLAVDFDLSDLDALTARIAAGTAVFIDDVTRFLETRRG